eukprot:CAMPEP_0184981192 /NCGR_PEP_ID=MMETSP1098-20130426/11024_1 /TAXON_ID=89044 /ORGANISM="Spumella elongata, Strain CCAP 955/1" /LENGTH=321 /DNA_ID=CAMNT_0027504735 /DNA_START=68 /DNA_END=1033 /DNA_ORIENTATION=+
MGFDNVAALSLGFMLVPFFGYIFVVLSQYRYLDSSNYRQTVLSVRASLFLPAYSFLMWISVYEPSLFDAMTVPINLVEGYSFYAFFSLILFNLGGCDQAVDTFVRADKDFFVCTCCFPADKTKFYRRTSWLLFHMLVTRVILSIGGAIASYSDKPVARVIALVIQVINAVIVLTMIVHVVNFYESIYEYAKNLFGLVKLFLLKCSVGLIVVEGLIANFLISTNKSPASADDGDDNYGTEAKTLRGYCTLVLIELVIISFVYMYAFGAVKIHPSSAPGFDNRNAKNGETVSFFPFYLDTLKFWDLYGTHKLTSELRSPLNPV